MDRSFDLPIALNNRGVELLQHRCCSRQASETFSEAFSSIRSRGLACGEISLKLTASLPVSSKTAASFHVESLFDRISVSRQSSRLNQLFDLKSLQLTFSIIRIDDTIINILPPGETKLQVLSLIILYNWGVACLGLALSQPKEMQHSIHLKALSLLERANMIMLEISGSSIGCNDFDRCKTYTQLAISYALWQAHRWSVGKRFLQSNTNMILYRRYCRLVRKVQILDKCLLSQHQHCSAAAA